MFDAAFALKNSFKRGCAQFLCFADFAKKHATHHGVFGRDARADGMGELYFT